MIEMFSIKNLRNPHWTNRNKLIGETMMDPNKTVLDLGCGAKDLLRYYTPTRYLGVDIAVTADIQINFDNDFELPAGWDYVVNSGILEYIDDPAKYLKRISTLGNEYIFTWWPGIGQGRMTNERMKEEFIQQYYDIVYETYWGPQLVVKCTPKR